MDNSTIFVLVIFLLGIAVIRFVLDIKSYRYEKQIKSRKTRELKPISRSPEVLEKEAEKYLEDDSPIEILVRYKKTTPLDIIVHELKLGKGPILLGEDAQVFVIRITDRISEKVQLGYADSAGRYFLHTLPLEELEFRGLRRAFAELIDILSDNSYLKHFSPKLKGTHLEKLLYVMKINTNS